MNAELSLLVAAKAKIYGDHIRKYLYSQFPATIGHVPLNLWLENLDAAIAREEAREPEQWAIRAAKELIERIGESLAIAHHGGIADEFDAAAIIQKHASRSLESELATALHDLATDAEYALKKWLNDGSYSISYSVSNARAILARFDEQQKGKP